MISKEIHESVYNAANAGDLFLLKKLLEEQADIVNSQDDHGFTALHGAVEGDSLLCVSFFIVETCRSDGFDQAISESFAYLQFT